MVLRILLLALLVLALVGAGLGATVVRGPLPETDGSLAVTGLEAPVTVYRDEWGVPHIFAASQEDLFFAQGYVTAQDRLWQMDFQRRVGAGRLSEVLGDSTLDTDRFLRTLGTYRAAERDLAVLSPETLAALDAYAAGVNAFIADNLDNLPLEFRLLGYQPEPWRPADSTVWGKMMAWNLGGNWETELMRARLIELLGAEKAADLLPGYPQEGPFIIPPEVKDYSGLLPLDLDRVMAVRRLLKMDGEGIGSNNWVVAGSRSSSGMPLLANDPHLGMQMPSVWYEVGLHSPTLRAVGVSFPGAPGVVIGHNGRIAWGVTNVNPDVQDLYIERVNPANPDQYEFQGTWRDMAVREEHIFVKGQQEPVIERVRETHHGPIMNAVAGDLEDEVDPVALRWTALEANRLSQSILELDQAQDWDQFRAALQHFAAPAQNFVYADVEGNIGYQMPGQIPIRAQGNGMVPVPGWSGEYEWVDTIPFEELPSVFNPEVGYVATANNQVVPDDYPYLISTEWSAPYRAQRIVSLLEGSDRHSPDDFAEFQGDIYLLPADFLVPLLDRVSVDEAPAVAQEGLRLMQAWDRQMDANQAEPLILEQFYQELVGATLGDELEAAGGEELVEDYLEDFGNSHRQLMERLAGDATSAWWDDVRTLAVESQPEIVTRAFLAAMAYLQENHGDDPARWRWGDVHWTNFDHPLGAVAPLDRILNKRVPAQGASVTVNAAGASYPDLVMNNGASFRQIVDLGDLANSRIVNTTGQSGQVFDRHYGDMIELWQEVGYHPMRLAQAEVEAAAVDVLTLEPSTK